MSRGRTDLPEDFRELDLRDSFTNIGHAGIIDLIKKLLSLSPGEQQRFWRNILWLMEQYPRAARRVKENVESIKMCEILSTAALYDKLYLPVEWEDK